MNGEQCAFPNRTTRTSHGAGGRYGPLARTQRGGPFFLMILVRLGVGAAVYARVVLAVGSGGQRRAVVGSGGLPRVASR